MPINFKDFMSQKIKDLQPEWKLKKLRSLPPDALIPTLTGRMSTFKIRTMPILEKNGVFSGTVTQTDVAKCLPPNIDILPISVLKKKSFNFAELSDGSQAFASRTVGDVFSEILNVGEKDKKIAVIGSETSLRESVERFTQRGAGNRRYRTLIIAEDSKYTGALSYLDVFNILLETKFRSTIGGFLDSKISTLPKKKIDTLSQEARLDMAINKLDTNFFTHIPVFDRNLKSMDIIGLVDEIVVRSLQYPVIYEYVEDMQLNEILEIQRPNFTELTVSENDTIEEALKKFTKSKTRPKTLLVGDLNSDSSIVSLKNTLSYVDVMQMFLEFAKDQLSQSGLIKDDAG